MVRPKMKINWSIVEDLLTAGCSGAEIAGYLGINKCTIYEKCREDHGMTFTEYSLPFYSKGDAMLRAHTYAKAMGKVADGDNALLIWLGKNRLKAEREEKEFESSLRRKEEETKRTDYKILVSHDLAAGSDLPTETVSEEVHPSAE